MPPEQGTGLQQQIGPLKLWQWGVGAVVLAVGWYWWRSRSAGSSSGGVQDASGGYTTADMNSGDYSSGYDSGYAAGLNATGSGTGSSSTGPTEDRDGNAQGPIAHARFHAKVKNPSGHLQTVVGYGNWIKKGGKWTWQVGIPRQFAIVGNGTGTGASSTAQDVQAQAVQPATAPDVSAPAAPVAASLSTAPGAATTLDQATGSAGAATAGGGGGTSAVGQPPKAPPTSVTRSGQSGGSAPIRTATTAQRVAQIVKDLQNPGPNFTEAERARYLAEYRTLVGHAYTGKLGQLQVGQHVQYATV